MMRRRTWKEVKQKSTKFKFRKRRFQNFKRKCKIQIKLRCSEQKIVAIQKEVQKEESVTPDQVEHDPVEHLQRGRAQEPQHQGDEGHADRRI